ncbi:Las1-domain-containing protein [Sistotremastrum niveocremeum HHB9708]|uniref:Las1-domain-containing protein n=1 Tax=Sistotremastrum niveocremeum HHB9708 TaxID=1314777 RepID=A0A164R7W9_9AGAM|nr:Las1-domain-containing protein [Sistotremastrum niveocremeum HHB9708]
MRLPRRVPWANIGELEQLSAWIYNDEHDMEAKVAAVNRLTAWQATTPLPHALESVLSFLTAVIADREDDSSTTLISSLARRQNYCTAVVRMVNGLVDRLQQGLYARSISSIAAQIGLPLWLVELRHAGTHEDLPSLPLLREATTESMNWLLNNFFIPTLSPASVIQPSMTLPSLEPLLKNYKTLRKLITRDTSLKLRHKTDEERLLRELERWISGAKIAASSGPFSGGSEGEDEANKEKIALEYLCDALVEKGALVPVSKKKRPQDKPPLTPPNEPLWSTLLLHVQEHHPTFADVFASYVISLLSTNECDDPSVDLCLASWLVWALENLQAENGLDNRAAISRVLVGLGRAVTGNSKTSWVGFA